MGRGESLQRETLKHKQNLRNPSKAYTHHSIHARCLHPPPHPRTQHAPHLVPHAFPSCTPSRESPGSGSPAHVPQCAQCCGTRQQRLWRSSEWWCRSSRQHGRLRHGLHGLHGQPCCQLDATCTCSLDSSSTFAGQKHPVETHRGHLKAEAAAASSGGFKHICTPTC